MASHGINKQQCYPPSAHLSISSEPLPPTYTFDTSPKNSYTAWGPGYMLDSIPLSSNALAYKGLSAFFHHSQHPCSWRPGWSYTSPIETPLLLKRAHTAIPLVVLSLGWPGSREVAIYTQSWQSQTSFANILSMQISNIPPPLPTIPSGQSLTSIQQYLPSSL